MLSWVWKIELIGKVGVDVAERQLAGVGHIRHVDEKGRGGREGGSEAEFVVPWREHRGYRGLIKALAGYEGTVVEVAVNRHHFSLIRS